MRSQQTQDLLDESLDQEQSEAPPRELTVEEAVAIAIHLQKNEQLAEAEEVYRQIFAVAPDHPEALHYAGVLAHQQGRHAEALALIEKSLGVVPDRADCYSNLGIVLQAQGDLDRAIGAYRHAISLDPGHANAYSNLGVLLRATGKPVEAEEAYRTAIRVDPGHVDAYTNLGVLLMGLKRTEEASQCYCKAIVLRPKHREARRLLALAHCTMGEVGEAVKIFEEWLDEEPEDPIARHMLAACTGRDIPVRASDLFVERTFDSFAATFESKLAKLSYRAPALVVAMLEDSGVEPSKSLDVLDAGCGTGLCGPLMAPYARRLTGVDLSAGMLAQAKEKNAYDVLIEGELGQYLRDNREAFDLIVSADALIYFGALEDVLAAAAGALRPNGLLIFTVEHAVGPVGSVGPAGSVGVVDPVGRVEPVEPVGIDAPLDYRLELHGRYSHSRGYVERLLAGAGLVSEIAQAELRMESGKPVAGLVVRATKPAGAGMSHA